MIPNEHAITREMQRTGFDRLICIRRINDRETILRRMKDRRHG